MNHSHLAISDYCVEAYQRADYAVNNFQYILPRPNLVVFRGTDSLRDVLSDVRMVLPWRFEAELDPLIEHLLQEPDLQFPITLAGHSMGAEIAKRVGIRFVKMGLPVQQIVAFAPPRTGHSHWLDRVHYAAYRNGYDLVTYVPFCRHQRPPYQLARPSLRVLSRHKMSEYRHLMWKHYG